MGLSDVFRWVLSIALVATPLAVTGAYAQTDQSHSQTLDQRKAAGQQRLQELKAKIETLKYAKLKTSLGMDEQTSQKFFEIYKPAEKDIQDVVKQRNEELKKLGQMMNGAKTDGDVDPEMQKIRDLNKQIQDRALKLDGDLKPVLQPRQRARLLVFEHEFAQHVNEQLLKHKLQNGAMARQKKIADLRRNIQAHRRVARQIRKLKR